MNPFLLLVALGLLGIYCSSFIVLRTSASAQWPQADGQQQSLPVDPEMNALLTATSNGYFP